MAAFPSVYPVSRDGYSVVGDDGSVPSRADDGTLKIRRMYAVTRYRITFQLAMLTATDSQAVRQFYESYKNEAIEWTDPYTGVTYDAHMLAQPRVTKLDGVYAMMEVTMEGVPQ